MLKKMKDFIKNNYIGILLILFVIVVFYVPVGYEIETDGGLIDLTRRIEVTPSYDMKGSINLTYVGGRRGTPFVLFLSKIIPTWDAYKTETMLIGEETYEENLRRSKVSLKESEQNAMYVALKAAGKDVSIKRYDLTAIILDPKSETDIMVGDVLKEVDGVKINNYDDLTTAINAHEVGDKIEATVIRNKKERKVYAVIREEEGRRIIGIYINPIIELEYEGVSIKFDTVSNAYGSSGGLMNTLLIYNKLTEEDITKGKVISGTGTISITGVVGEIEGVAHKLRGAYKKGANIFICPSKNYKEAMEVKEKYKMDIEIIEATTFDNLLEKLKAR